MPQYFFHVTDGHSRYRDEEGSLHLSFADAQKRRASLANWRATGQILDS